MTQVLVECIFSDTYNCVAFIEFIIHKQKFNNFTPVETLKSVYVLMNIFLYFTAELNNV